HFRSRRRPHHTLKESFVMKFVVLVATGLVVSLVATRAHAAGAPQLTWQDLYAHPELRPYSCKLTVPMELRDGTKLAAGTELAVFNVVPSKASCYTDDMASVEVTPDTCDLLDSAVKMLAKLSPQQRAMRVDMMWGDPTLCPPKVTLCVNLKV